MSVLLNVFLHNTMYIVLISGHEILSHELPFVIYPWTDAGKKGFSGNTLLVYLQNEYVSHIMVKIVLSQIKELFVTHDQ